MKFLLITFALVGIASAALPDSATQGPNPQDIATPEPEYIDIDLPEPPKPAPVQRPAPVQQRTFAAPAPVLRSFAAPVQRQYIAPHPLPQPIIHSAPIVQHRQPQPVSGHLYNSISGYQYKRPQHLRRAFYHRYF